MKLIFSPLAFAIFGLLVISTRSASTTNGKLLKFYPITKEHYRDLVALAKKQPVVSEADIIGSHRSIADWSTTLQNNWNSLLNSYGGFYKNLTVQENPEKSYPMCVIKTHNPLRVKRSGTQFDDGYQYAAVAPNVPFSSLYYGTPQRNGRQYPHIPFINENTDDVVGVQINVGNGDGENEDVHRENYGGNGDGYDVENGYNDGFVAVPNFVGDHYSHDRDHENTAPVINCVVVLKEKKRHRYPYPQYPPYQYPGVPGQPPFPYNPYPYVPAIPYKSYPSQDHTSSRSNEFPAMDPAVVAQYQRMMAKYYRHLNALYNANSDSDDYSNHNNDDVDDDGDNGEKNDDIKKINFKKDNARK